MDLVKPKSISFFSEVHFWFYIQFNHVRFFFIYLGRQGVKILKCHKPTFCSKITLGTFSLRNTMELLKIPSFDFLSAQFQRGTPYTHHLFYGVGVNNWALFRHFRKFHFLKFLRNLASKIIIFLQIRSITLNPWKLRTT